MGLCKAAKQKISPSSVREITLGLVAALIGEIPDSSVFYISEESSRRSPVGSVLSQSSNMYCILWVIFQILAVVVEAGVSSGSAEALAKAAAKNNGGAAAAGNGVNAQNGAPLIGETIARLLQLGGSLFIQPVGNPGGQAPLQQLIPLTALQQGGANGNLQGQMAGQPAGGPVMVFAMLPQNNDPRQAASTPGQMQMIPVAVLGNQQVPGGAAAAGPPLGRLRFQRSVATRLRRTQSPLMKTAATEEEEDEEEESSGVDPDEKHQTLDHTTPTSVP